jgi:uncharacterized protein YyaL (SSP411 family)
MRVPNTTMLLTILCVIGSVVRSPAVDDKPEKPKHTNRLAKESSPYLLQHAHNPVDWFPWGDEAFEKAKKEGKLVFLSVGYSSCHWCHVMEKESFDNEEVAKILNEHFVCIKVDREERPDIDQIYLAALSAMKRGGGWPMSLFLTPEGKPVFGGTYWPREDRKEDGEIVNGFKSILKKVYEGYRDRPREFQEFADDAAEKTKVVLKGLAIGEAVVDLDRELVTAALDELKERFDPVHGGFGTPAKRFKGPKFPTPPDLSLLQQEASRPKSDELSHMLTLTLDRMARGGIYDHLGGGFHRYSTERTWTVPHFEKMLYDNAQLSEIYARQYRATKNPVYKKVVQETLAFVGRELTSPEGAFYSALDADSEGSEGRFYIWTAKEIDAVLPKKADADLVKQVYGAEEPNFEETYSIFVLPRSLADRAEALKMTEAELTAKLAPLTQKLFEARSKRPRPFLDTKVLTAWNGQMIAGYAVAGQCLEEPRYTQAAAKAADFVLTKMRTKDGRLLRTYGTRPGTTTGEARLNAYLDDYAYFIHGLLCLHDATKDKKWLDEAKALTDVMVKYYGDPKAGGFYYTSSDHEKLFARSKDQYDGAQPSGNSAAAGNLVRLWQKTGNEQYRKLAEKSLKAFAGGLKTNPASLTTMCEALALYLDATEKK